MGLFKNWVRHVAHAQPRRRTRLNVEALESRVVPYVTSGNAWPAPQLVTISFVPDGTDLGGVNSNLFAKFNGHKGWTTSTWQNQILKAAQQWAQATNINFAVVSDDGEAIGGGTNQQGDPNLGDIRIGGYNFGTGDLASAYMPPPVNNFSIAGDIQFNTGQPFNIGTTYDLFSVAVHEFGHALGLYHSTYPGAVMQAAYHIRTGLTSDDSSGIENIYSNNAARTPDRYNTTGHNNSFAAAANITPSQLTEVVSNLDLTVAGWSEYYTFTAPTGTSSNLTVKAQSSGLSLLAPTLTVYNSSQTQIGSASGAGQYGTTLSVTISGVTAGQQYYVKVAGADATALGTGAYALTLNFGTGASPTVPLPNTALPDGNPLTSGGGTPLSKGTTPPGENAGFDRFDPNEANRGEQPSPAAVTAPKTVAAPAGPATAVGTARPLLPTATGLAPVTTIVAGPGTPAAPVVVTLPALNVGAAVRPPAGASVESGGGNNGVLSNLSDAQDLLPGNEPAGNALDAPLTTPAPEGLGSQYSVVQWRAATTVCFTTDESLTTVRDRSVASATLEGRETSPAFDAAAAAVGFLIVLGGYWSRPPDAQRTRKRRPDRN